MRTREDFEEYLEETLIPQLEGEKAKLDELRAMRFAVKLPRKTKGLIIGVGFAFALALGSFGAMTVALALPFAIDLYRMSRVRGPGVMDVRQGLIRKVIEFWGPEFAYHPYRGVSSEVVEASRLIPEKHDRFGSCDLVEGKHGATAFRFSEVRLRKKVRKDQYEVVWSGLFIEADFNKSFDGRIFVLPDASEKLLGSMLARTLQRLPFIREGKLIHMENPRFERHFRVYAEDDHETRYVLSPSLMRRMVEFKEDMGLDVRMAFIDNRMLVALPIDADFFGAPPSLERVTPDFIRSWVDEIHYVTGILDELDLNTRIWSK